MENYAKENNLKGLVEGLGNVLEIYASEAMAGTEEYNDVIERFRK